MFHFYLGLMSFLLAGESNLEASAIHWFSTVWKTGRYLWCRSYLPFIVRNLTIMVLIILCLVLLIQGGTKFYFSHALRENPYCMILYENNLSHFVTVVSGWRKKDSNQQIFWLMYSKGFTIVFFFFFGQFRTSPRWAGKLPQASWM